jgi:hypothetical protein
MKYPVLPPGRGFGFLPANDCVAMNLPVQFDSAAHQLLEELDVRHDQLLEELDRLNARVDAVLAQFAPPAPTSAGQLVVEQIGSSETADEPTVEDGETLPAEPRELGS